MRFTPLVAALALCGPAQAANHALLMAVDYAGTSYALPGIDLDVVQARQIAKAMGVPEANTTTLRNRELTLAGMSGAIAALAGRIGEGDKVFIYYSGHGTQHSGSNSKCSEALVSADLRRYFDVQLQADLDKLASKASQVVMLNDSCHSGGTATRSMPQDTEPQDYVPKFLPVTATALASAASGASAADDANPRCGVPINSLSRSLVVSSTKPSPQLVYLAASAANEITFASSKGSYATRAWAHCVQAQSADTDGSHTLSATELQSCAQGWVNTHAPRARQTLSLVGNTTLPMSFVGGSDNKPPATARAALDALRTGRDAQWRVGLKLARTQLRVQQDPLDFTVTTSRAGYLYVWQVGSDGKSFNLLFPNGIDRDNALAAGAHRLPRPSWRVSAGGPEGSSHLLAVMLPKAFDFGQGLDTTQVFLTIPTHEAGFRELQAKFAAQGKGGFGASDVARVDEVR